MSNSFTDAWLLHYSEEHLMHELSMLWETGDALLRHKNGSVEYTALLESFAVHLRNLIEFFFFDASRDYVRAEHFLDDPASWSPAKPAEITKLYGCGSNEVEHLTRNRISGNPPEKEWNVPSSLSIIETVAKDFVAKASAKKLYSKVREFLNLHSSQMLLWIGNNVAHSNVASHTTVVSSQNASTANKII
jgi:hypothetical protein